MTGLLMAAAAAEDSPDACQISIGCLILAVMGVVLLTVAPFLIVCSYPTGA